MNQYHNCVNAQGNGLECFKCSIFIKEQKDNPVCPFQRYCYNEKRWVSTNCKDNCKNFQSKTE